MKRVSLCLILLIVPVKLLAFSTKDLLALVAMPLAVAAVSDVTGVPQDQLTDIVSTLNQANVPPQQFVEVVRYVPVTYEQTAAPTFADLLRTETSRGVTGQALVTAITQRLRTDYNVTPQLDLSQPATEVVVERDYIPTATALNVNDPLALIALPLAVAAAADVTGIPQNQLADLVATLNNANVPVAQEIQVIRYAPVALTTDNGQFVDFVQTQVTNGVTGPALVPVVVQRLQTFYPQAQPIVFNAPSSTITPEPVVVTRVESFRAGHPHGGPPGQIKKQLGLQTGAEVVHGVPPMISSARVEGEHEHGHGHGHGEGHGRKERVQVVAPPVVVQQPVMVVPQGKPGKEHGEGHGNEGHGGGKGHGHGKDD